MSTSESLFLKVDPELLRQIDELARAAKITRHEAARIALELGVRITKKPKGGRPCPAQLSIDPEPGERS